MNWAQERVRPLMINALGLTNTHAPAETHRIGKGMSTPSLSCSSPVSRFRKIEF